jgi:hypothetical protein
MRLPNFQILILLISGCHLEPANEKNSFHDSSFHVDINIIKTWKFCARPDTTETNLYAYFYDENKNTYSLQIQKSDTKVSNEDLLINVEAVEKRKDNSINSPVITKKINFHSMSFISQCYIHQTEDNYGNNANLINFCYHDGLIYIIQYGFKIAPSNNNDFKVPNEIIEFDNEVKLAGE